MAALAVQIHSSRIVKRQNDSNVGVRCTASVSQGLSLQFINSETLVRYHLLHHRHVCMYACMREYVFTICIHAQLVLLSVRGGAEIHCISLQRIGK